MGERAQSKIDPPGSVDPMDAGKAVCDLSPRPSGCDTLDQAKRLVVTSAIGLGLGAVTMAVFAGLLGRHRAQHRIKAPSTVFLVPGRSGIMGGFSLRF
jgi:predicted hotdog family 3-hydroxylacyl-ACP dehydratase